MASTKKSAPAAKTKTDSSDPQGGSEAPKNGGLVCTECNRRQPKTRFQQLTRNPVSYNPICKACTSKMQASELKEKLRGHQNKKIIKEAVKENRTQLRNAYNQRNRDAKRAKKQRELANKELASRKLAQRHILPFIKRFHPRYQDGWIHRLVCKKLEQFSRDVVEQKSPRLMIWMPPRIGKSEIASKNFPAWHLGRNPQHEIIAASYAVSLPMGFSRSIKEMVGDPAFSSVFPECQLHKTAQATEGWRTTQQGGYVPAGVGGGITGKGAHVLIIDDPVKDAEEADSETQRDKVWDWYGSTAYTRLAPGGGVLCIQTRWHDDDLSGRILRKSSEKAQEIALLIESVEGEMVEASNRHNLNDTKAELAKLYEERDFLEDWELLIFPQIATQDEFYDVRRNQIVYEIPKNDNPSDNTDKLYVQVRKKNDPLHPERYTRRMVQLQKDTLQPRHWSALHQQNPVPEEGAYFTKAYFRFEQNLHDWKFSDVYIAGDLAIGEKQQNDWTVLLIGAVDYDRNLHIVDMVRFKGGSNIIIDNVCAILEKYNRRLVKWGLEQGQIQMALWPQLLDTLKDKSIAAPFDDSLRPITDKAARARVAQGMMQQGRILLPENQPWVQDFMAELLRFPGGLHDDVVDALAWLARMAVNVPAPSCPKHKQLKSWKDDLGKYLSTGNESFMGS